MSKTKMLRKLKKDYAILSYDILDLLITTCDDRQVGAVIRGVVRNDLYDTFSETEDSVTSSFVSVLKGDPYEELEGWGEKLKRIIVQM